MRTISRSDRMPTMLVGISDHHGTDLVLVKDLDDIAKSGRWRDCDDRGAFVGQDSFDCHGYPPLMLFSSPDTLRWESKDA